jgi:hypothetical protein
MSKGIYPLKLPASTKAAAARLAKEDGVSLNQWIDSAVAQKVGAVETAATFIEKRAGFEKRAACEKRAGGARAEDLRAILDLVPDRVPDPGDEVPAEP